MRLRLPRIDPIEACLVGAILLLVGLMAWSVYAEYTAEHFSLRKDRWSCTQSTLVTELMPVSSGNGQVMMVPTTRAHCVQYTRTR